MNKIMIAVACSVAVLSGCSSTGVKISDSTRSIESFKENRIEFPEWYTSIPKEDGAIYATATEVSSDLQFCIDKSLMSAKREIAFKLQNDISQKTREMSVENNFSKSENLSKMTERLVVAESNHVNLVGVQRIRSEVIREGNRYRAFVLVRYGLDESNKIHMNYIVKERKAAASKELKQYEQELKQAKVENQ